METRFACERDIKKIVCFCLLVTFNAQTLAMAYETTEDVPGSRRETTRGFFPWQLSQREQRHRGSVDERNERIAWLRDNHSSGNHDQDEENPERSRPRAEQNTDRENHSERRERRHDVSLLPGIRPDLRMIREDREGAMRYDIAPTDLVPIQAIPAETSQIPATVAEQNISQDDVSHETNVPAVEDIDTARTDIPEREPEPVQVLPGSAQSVDEPVADAVSSTVSQLESFILNPYQEETRLLQQMPEIASTAISSGMPPTPPDMSRAGIKLLPGVCLMDLSSRCTIRAEVHTPEVDRLRQKWQESYDRAHGSDRSQMSQEERDALDQEVTQAANELNAAEQAVIAPFREQIRQLENQYNANLKAQQEAMMGIKLPPLYRDNPSSFTGGHYDSVGMPIVSILPDTGDATSETNTQDLLLTEIPNTIPMVEGSLMNNLPAGLTASAQYDANGNLSMIHYTNESHTLDITELFTIAPSGKILLASRATVEGQNILVPDRFTQESFAYDPDESLSSLYSQTSVRSGDGQLSVVLSESLIYSRIDDGSRHLTQRAVVTGDPSDPDQITVTSFHFNEAGGSAGWTVQTFTRNEGSNGYSSTTQEFDSNGQLIGPPAPVDPVPTPVPAPPTPEPVPGPVPTPIYPIIPTPTPSPSPYDEATSALIRQAEGAVAEAWRAIDAAMQYEGIANEAVQQAVTAETLYRDASAQASNAAQPVWVGTGGCDGEWVVPGNAVDPAQLEELARNAAQLRQAALSATSQLDEMRVAAYRAISHADSLVDQVQSAVDAANLELPQSLQGDLDAMAPINGGVALNAWHLAAIGVGPEVWASNRGQGVTVAVIDSGVDRNHPAFYGNILNGWDYWDNDSDPGNNSARHGTMTAGVVDTIAPGVSILPMRVFDENLVHLYGAGWLSDAVDSISDATRWLADHTMEGQITQQTERTVSQIIDTLTAPAARVFEQLDELSGGRLGQAVADLSGFIAEIGADISGFLGDVLGDLPPPLSPEGFLTQESSQAMLQAMEIVLGGIKVVRNVVHAIHDAVDQGADIINMSMGVPDLDAAVRRYSSGALPMTMESGIQSLLQTLRSSVQGAVNYADDRGVFVVAASLNDGGNADEVWPAGLDHVITVGATRHDGTIASFSNTGNSLDIVAPGVDIFSASAGTTGYGTSWGTSFATPMVSATLALLIAQYPGESHDSILNRLRSGATDLGNFGWDPVYGNGLLNISNSLRLNPVMNTPALEIPPVRIGIPRISGSSRSALV